MKHAFLMSASALALAACAANSTDPVYTQFHRPAGSITDTGDFGNATMNNIQVMTGEKKYTLDLARKFAADVPSTINFDFNSARIDAEAAAVLRQQADWMRQFPEARFRVFGHTDLVGSDAYNKRLGLRRANAVVNFLVSHGISRSRLEAVISEGETMPLIPTEDRERQNRRTVTEVSGFVKRADQLLDGKYAQIIYREYIASAVPATTISGTSIASDG